MDIGPRESPTLVSFCWTVQSQSLGNEWTHKAPVLKPVTHGGRWLLSAVVVKTSKQVLATELPKDGFPREHATVSRANSEFPVGSIQLQQVHPDDDEEDDQIIEPPSTRSRPVTPPSIPTSIPEFMIDPDEPECLLDNSEIDEDEEEDVIVKGGNGSSERIIGIER